MNVKERFLQYVKFDTGSDETSLTVPSTDKQKVLGAYLVEEMKAIGLENPYMDEYGYVYGFLPATKGCEKEPAIGLIAHMDTVSEVKCCDIKPKCFIYQGGDILLENGLVTGEKEFPWLKNIVGDELIVTDGTTILGADDKAGIAIILTAVEELIAHPEIKHGKVCVGFTPDEEIGRGPDHFDVKGFGAEFAYTVDGGGVGGIEYENFNAGSCVVKVKGVNIHPGSAKDKMVNAALLACEYVDLLPKNEIPAHTEGYEGFYHLTDMEGDVAEATLRFIIRDHDAVKYQKRMATMHKVGDFLNEKYGEGTFTVTTSDSYRNMKEKILPKMFVVERMMNAMKQVGLTPEIEPIRGGTDGATLSFMGLPCPNISTGGFNGHGERELCDVNMMETMKEVCLNVLSAEQ